MTFSAALAFHGVGYLATGNEPRQTGNRHPSIAPYGVFRCADTAIVIAVGSESPWQRDILERNPRFLTRSKNFPGFSSFGPWIVGLDDVLAKCGSLGAVEVSTVINGVVHRSNTVSNMTFDPAFLVSFHSMVMPVFPGDIISTGTPGAVRVTPGDVAECRIPGVGVLANPVIAGR